MTAVLLFALLLCLTGCGSAGQPETDEAPAYLVAVTAGETSGSGILYQQDDAYLYVLTAAHVVSCMNPGTGAVLRFFDGQELSCGDIRISEVSDLALIRIPADRISETQRNACLCVPSDKESFDRLQTGDGCTAIGLHAESGALRHEGHILEPWIYMEDYGQYMIWADAEVRPGMSGGGLLDQEGRLIGILSGGSQDGELAAVPLSLILQFMEDMDCASR